jgi:hypothetical protein
MTPMLLAAGCKSPKKRTEEVTLFYFCMAILLYWREEGRWDERPRLRVKNYSPKRDRRILCKPIPIGLYRAKCHALIYQQQKLAHCQLFICMFGNGLRRKEDRRWVERVWRWREHPTNIIFAASQSAAQFTSQQSSQWCCSCSLLPSKYV